MNKHINNYFDETYYTETLNNGLRVIIFHKPEFNTTTCSFGTPYGALKINQKINDKKHCFNPGIAHFLEHKLFETKGDDILNEFSAMGASVNAFTSYSETVYYFSKSGDDIDRCLNLLLDFVQSLDISEESVEKEKGIIVQELAMYMQMPDQRLLQETYKCLYKNFPLKYDVGGDSKSVNRITKNELEECYKINYHPANMVLCISTPIDPNKIIEIIKNNQDKKEFSPFIKPINCNIDEPDEVVKKSYSFKMPINTNKHIYAYKIKPDFTDLNDCFKKEWALRILLECYFSSLNPDYQKWIDEKIINDFFGYDVDFNMDYANIFFYIENNDKTILKTLIDDTLKNDLINEDKIEQLKHRFIGAMFEVFNDIESFNNGYLRDCLQELDFFKALEDLKAISLNDVENVGKYLSCPHRTYVSMLKE